MEDRISKLETVTQDSVREVAILKPQVDRVQSVTDDLKLQMHVLSDECANLKAQLGTMRQELMKVESKETDKNILIWNVLAKDSNDAKILFEDIVLQGLEMIVSPECSMTEVNSV